MRLKALTIKNFKGIDENGVRIELAPITLLFGPNNAGKSTILQALHLARVIICHPKTSISKIDALGNVLNIGSFEDYVHLHDKDRIVKIGLELSQDDLAPELEAPAAQLDPILILISVYFDKEMHEVKYDFTCAFSSRHNIFTFEISELTQSIDKELFNTPKALGTPKYVALLFLKGITKFDYAIEYLCKKLTSGISSKAPVLGAPLKKFGAYIESHQGDSSSFIKAGNFLKSYIKLDTIGNKIIQLGEKLRDIEQIADLDAKGRYFAVINELDEATYKDKELRKRGSKAYRPLLRWIQEFLNQIFYIGPLRTIPRRDVTKPSQVQYADWAEGNAAWEKLLGATEEQLCAINSALHGNGSLEADYTVKHGNTSQNKRLFLHNERSNIDVEPHDVGTGISQILPVITAAVLESNALVMVAQPELHMHPKLQTNLGDILIRATQTNDSMFLLETHSEHLLLRLLKRIRQTHASTTPEGLSFRHTDLSVNWIGNEDGQTYALWLELDEDGSFNTPWPEGFFDERGEELFG